MYEYNTSGQLHSVTDKISGEVTVYEYDAAVGGGTSLLGSYVGKLAFGKLESAGKKSR